MRSKQLLALAEHALADLKAKGMQTNELPAAESARMRDKLTKVNATIATNVGMDLWRAYGLIFVSGDQLGANASITFPTVPPGQQADISIEMKAPTTPGHYRGYWMLKDAQGNKFGLGTSADKSFWVDINVPGTTTQSPTSTPDSQGTVLDFTKDMCTARWVSGAGQLPCPLTDGDARGFVLTVDNPKLENGITDSAPGLLMAPQNKYNGYLQGFYSEMIVRPGDHFKASVGCAYGYSCLSLGTGQQEMLPDQGKGAGEDKWSGL